MKSRLIAVTAILAHLGRYARDYKMTEDELLRRIPRRHRRGGGRRLSDRQASPKLRRLLTARRAPTDTRIGPFDHRNPTGGRQTGFKVGRHERVFRRAGDPPAPEPVLDKRGRVIRFKYPKPKRFSGMKVRETGRRFGE